MWQNVPAFFSPISSVTWSVQLLNATVTTDCVDRRMYLGDHIHYNVSGRSILAAAMKGS